MHIPHSAHPLDRWTARALVGFLVVVLLLGVGPSGGAPAALGKEEGAYFVAGTSQHIADPFLSAWMDLSGPDRLGMPVSSAHVGNGRTTQYFERGVLQTKGDGDVAVMPTGRILLDRPDPSAPHRTGRRQPAPRETRAFTALRNPPRSDTVAYDRETGHAIKGAMLGAYKELGGDDVLGAPLSEAHQSGTIRVQWFEFGRLEARGGTVVPGPVGTELAVLDGADLRPKRRGSLALFETDAGPPLTPVRIQIPVLGVDAAIEPVGIVDGVMQTPVDPLNVGWYTDLGGPGSGGNTVMTGHRDWYSIGPVVFWDLGALGVGDEVRLLDGDGGAARYVVYESFAVDASTPPSDVIGDQGGETLTLITCGGEFSVSEYDQRIIVRARRA